MALPAVVTTGGIFIQENRKVINNRQVPEETPVALVYNGSTYAVMMASPDDIADFALGFSMTEGIIDVKDQLSDLEIVQHDTGIEARMWLSPQLEHRLAQRRRFIAGPVGCGLCGIDSLEQANRVLPVIADNGVRFTSAEVALAPDLLKHGQVLHAQTHATHAAGFLLPGCGVVLVKEDVGRHNAMDKLIGAVLRQGYTPSQGAFVLTSRLSVELVQKCAMTGGSAIIAVSAPTAHALRLAHQAGITVAAFARRGGFEIHTHPERILNEDNHE